MLTDGIAPSKKLIIMARDKIPGTSGSTYRGGGKNCRVEQRNGVLVAVWYDEQGTEIDSRLIF